MKKFLLVLLGCITMAGCGEAKVTDPNDPRFDPMKFDFEDYSNVSKFKEAIEKIISVSSNKYDFVDRIFVEKGGAKTKKLEEYSHCKYYYYEFSRGKKVKEAILNPIYKGWGWTFLVCENQENELFVKFVNKPVNYPSR